MIKRQLYDLFNEPISEQQRRYFLQYFHYDISEKTYNLDEFCHLLQIRPTLGILHFSIYTNI